MMILRLRIVFLAVFAVAFSPDRLSAASWQKVQTEYFTVLSQSSEREARAWAARLERFRMCMELMFPDESRQLEPVTVLIFRRDRDFNPFKPPQLGDPERLAGVFQRGYGRSLIGMSSDYSGRELNELIFHEATHWFFASRGAGDPIWVTEGLAEAFSTFRIENGEAIFGGDNLDDILALRRHGFMYVREIMNAPRYKVHSVKNEQTLLFYAHSWLLANYIFIDGNLGGREALSRYLARTGRGEPYDEAFKAEFGLTYEELDKQLDAYFGSGKIGDLRTPVDNLEVSFKLSGEPASEADVNTALAFFLIAQGRHELARPYLEKAQAAAPEDPRVYEGWAELAEAAGNKPERDRLYTEAVARGSQFHEAHFYMAAAPAQKYVGKEAAADAPRADEVNQAMESLRKVVRLRPSYYPAYEVFAGMMGCVIEPEAGDREILLEGMRRFPDSPQIALGLAAYDLRTGRLMEAKDRIDALRADDDLGWWDFYAKKLLYRIKAMVDLAWLRRAAKTDDFEAAQKFHQALRQGAVFPVERREANALLAGFNQRLTLERARASFAKGDTDMASFYLEQIAGDEMSPEIAEEYATLQAEIKKPRK